MNVDCLIPSISDTLKFIPELLNNALLLRLWTVIKGLMASFSRATLSEPFQEAINYYSFLISSICSGDLLNSKLESFSGRSAPFDSSSKNPNDSFISSSLSASTIGANCEARILFYREMLFSLGLLVSKLA